MYITILLWHHSDLLSVGVAISQIGELVYKISSDLYVTCAAFHLIQPKK
jgi:hypothetical protein